MKRSFLRKYKISLNVLLCLAFHNVVCSQKFEFGKVSVKELEQKIHPRDSAAVAAVLYNKGTTKFDYADRTGFTTEHLFEMRIKIYRKEGLSYANYEVPYYIGYENLNPDRIEIMDAVTYNLVNGKIEQTKLGSDGTFKDKVNSKWKTATITLPNVRVGSVIEFRYKLKSEDIFSFPTFVFQRDIPVDYVEYNTEVPVRFGYKQVIKGTFQGITSKSVVESNAISFRNPTTTRNDVLEFSQVKTTFTGRDVPALVNEHFVDNLDNYRSAVEHELEVVREQDERNNKSYSKTWEDVAREIYRNPDFGKQLLYSDYYLADLRQLLSGIDSSDQRLQAVYDFVKTRMNWNGDYGYTTDKGVQNAWVDRTGNSAEINFILIAMLKSAGIDAAPVLISTVRHGVPAFPNQAGFNYLIAAAQIDGKRILLDACNKKGCPNILPLYTLNWTGRLIRDNGVSEEISMQPEVLSKNLVSILCQLGADGKLSGKARWVRSDYSAFEFRNTQGNRNQQDYLQTVENNWPGIEVNSYVQENTDDLTKPVQETFGFTHGNLVEKTGDRMLINPLLFLANAKNPFTSETRSYPIFFGYPHEDRYSIAIEIPDGYAVESVPESLSLSTGENVGQFKFTIVQQGNKIQVSKVDTWNQTLVAAGFYPNIQEFFRKVSDKQNEKIVLKKI